MSESGIARIFKHRRSQSVRLPLAFHLPGDRVRVRRVEGGILLEPIMTDLDAWFRELDRFADVPFMEEGRRQPPVPEPEDPFEIRDVGDGLGSQPRPFGACRAR
jgi:antitoxin VapB